MPSIEQPSVQSLLIRMRFNDQQLSTGTAFVVMGRTGRWHLITNRHNVTGRHQDTGAPLSSTGGIPNNIVIVHNRLARLGEWIEKTEDLHDQDGSPRWIEHPTLGARADFVALPLTQTQGVSFFPYDPGNPGQNIKVGPADPVSVIGFPFGLSAGGAFPIWVTGTLASEPDVDYDNFPLVLIDCRSRPGQSGSPVLAYRPGGMIRMADGNTNVFNGPVARFIGIYSGRINEQSDIGRVWKASAIAELVHAL